MQKDWLFSTDEYICDLRTVALFKIFLLLYFPVPSGFFS